MAKRKDPAAVALGRKGGKARTAKMTPDELSAWGRAAGAKGGQVRAEKLSPRRASQIAKKAAAARWKKARRK